MLADLKGGVIVIQFLYTTSENCEATAAWLSLLRDDLGPRGPQLYGVAFNDGVSSQDLINFQKWAKFPVAISKKEAVLKFLGLPTLKGMDVPQIVVIDRNGMIRAQTKPRPGGDISDYETMRKLLNQLLNEK
jgi:hypothetical protein